MAMKNNNNNNNACENCEKYGECVANDILRYLASDLNDINRATNRITDYVVDGDKSVNLENWTYNLQDSIEDIKPQFEFVRAVLTSIDGDTLVKALKEAQHKMHKLGYFYSREDYEEHKDEYEGYGKTSSGADERQDGCC